MKKVQTRFGFMRLLQALIVLSFIGTVQNVHAASGMRATVVSGATHQDSVTVAGITEKEIFVDVRILNVSAEKLVLTIENDRGDELFKKEIDRTSFSTRFRLQKEDNVSGYSLVIRSANHSLKEKYTIKTATKLIEDVTITKL